MFKPCAVTALTTRSDCRKKASKVIKSKEEVYRSKTRRNQAIFDHLYINRYEHSIRIAEVSDNRHPDKFFLFLENWTYLTADET